jgi:hypothetical protein
MSIRLGDVDDVVEHDPSVAELLYEETPPIESADGEDFPDIEDVSETLASRARREVERVEDELPFSADIVRIVVVRRNDTALANAAPLEVYFSAEHGNNGERVWKCDKRPEGFAIMIATTVSRHDCPVEDVTRHELAHCANWWEEQRTVEGTGIHDEWLDRLDAPY